MTRTSAYALEIGLALAVVSWPVVTNAADPCPRGVKQEQPLEGGDGDVSWYSNATLEKLNDKDWCFDRKVVLRKPDRQYVDWPNGEIRKKTVDKELTTRSCCYPGPRAEDGDLEHGFSGKKISTKVYRGSGEPQQKIAWVSMEGSVYFEPTTVRLDITLRSVARKTPRGFEYSYEIVNLGDPLNVVWQSAESEFFSRVVRENKLEYPLALRAATGVVRASGASTSEPAFIARDVILRSVDGKEVFRMSAPAYIPK